MTLVIIKTLPTEQNFESLDTTIGLRFQYVLTPNFGVIVPFWNIGVHSEHEVDPRTITAGYSALENILGSNTFAVPTDKKDDSYLTASVGFSVVFRGGRQREVGGPISGGLMGFFQLKTIENLQNYDDQVFTGGIRYEF